MSAVSEPRRGLPHDGVLGVATADTVSPGPGVPHAGILGVPAPPSGLDPRIPHAGVAGERLPVTTPSPIRTPKAVPRPLPSRLSRAQLRSLVRARDALLASQLRVHELEDLVHAETKQRIRLLSALRKTIDLGAQSDVVKGGLGGRTAIESYRNVTVANFMRHMNDMGVIAVAFGAPRAQMYLQTVISADFQVLFATDPTTEAEGSRRALAEWMITDPASCIELTGSEEFNERARRRLINLALRSGVDTSTHELVRRSSEMQRSSGPVPRDDD